MGKEDTARKFPEEEPEADSPRSSPLAERRRLEPAWPDPDP